MSNLTTRKIVLGTLMVLVLAFSVQGIADALTFGTSRTGDLQTKLPNEDITISFTVVPGSNTTPIRNDDGKLVSASDTPGGSTRINSAGYKVKEIGGTDYRTSTAAQALNASDLSDDTTRALFYKKGSNYIDASPSNFVVGNSNTTVYEEVSADTKAYQVYLRTGDPDAEPPVAYRYATVTAEPDAKVSDTNRYHFNQEAISIEIPQGLMLKRVGRYTVNKSDSHTMNEMRNSVNEDKLSSGTINLTYTASVPGRISD